MSRRIRRNERYRGVCSGLATLAGLGGFAALAGCTTPQSREEPTGTVGERLTTVAFQQHALPDASYSGASDATLREAAPNTNEGANTRCLIDGDDAGAGDLACALRWSLSGIPAGSTITAANIALNVTNQTGNTYNVYALLRPWNQAQVTWNQAASSSPWATPGAQGASDRGALIGSFSGATVGTLTIPLNAAGLSTVQSWLNDSANYGVIIAHPTSTDGVDVATSEDTTPGVQPKLTVSYEPAASVPKVTHTYSEADPSHVNPERGWQSRINLLSGGPFTSTHSGGRGVAYAPVILRRAGVPVSTTVSQVQTGLNAVRAAHIKVILRIYYRDPDDAQTILDPDIATIESDMQAFAGVLANNADVISVLQAGFVGDWGEFHDSHIIDEGNASRVLDKMYSVMPPGMMAQFRTPLIKKTYFGRGQLADAEAFTGTPVARGGHYNDCFLSNTDDSGTYYSPQTESRAFVAQDTRYTPMGGETCPPGARNDCSTALGELAQFHWTFISQDWWPGTVSADPAVGKWAAQGCRSEVTERLGYRFVLEQVTRSQAVRPGDLLELDVQLRNEGFAALYNQRQLYAVLQGPGGTFKALLSPAIDPRRWAPGAVAFSRKLSVPASVAPGTYTLSLWVPDAAPSIRDVPDYAIHFSSNGGWDAANGYNTLTTSLSISSSATPNPGTGDATFQ